jgi:serine phosphatase RsbU (regulator of sigma subunit)
MQDKLQAFSGDRQQRDDLTLVVVGVNDLGEIPHRAAAS